MKEFVYKQLLSLEENNWWFQGRKRIISAFLALFLKDERDLKILDAGCGAGSVITVLEKFGAVTGVDNYQPLVEGCRRNGFNVICADVVNLPFPADSFDCIVSLEVLEHLDDDNKALNEFYRILKKGGTLFVSVPAFTVLWGNQDLAAEHKRRYSLDELKEKLIKNGFSIQKITYVNFILFPFIVAVRVLRKFIVKQKPQLDSDYFSDKPLLNRILSFIFGLEAFIVPYLNPPFGVTLFSVARK